MNSRSATELRQAIRLPHATAMVVGTIIGASIFVQPSEITGAVPSIVGVMSVWLVSGVLTMAGALVCAELASTFTETGGVYVYLREAYNPATGFLWGWAMFWSMHSGIIAAIAVVFARYSAYFLPLGDAGIKVVAMAVIVALSAVNYLGVKHGSTLQTLFTAGKVLAIVLIIGIGFIFGSQLPDHFVAGQVSTDGITLSSFLTALVAGLFAFGGWHMVTYSSEETVTPSRTIPRALLIGIAVVTACYIAMNTVYLYILPLDDVAASTRIAADTADVLLGSGGGGLMSAIVMFSTFGALSGIVLAGPRVYYSMARDGMLFAWVGAIHRKHRTPYLAIVLQAVWCSILVMTGTFRALFTRVIYTEWLFFGLMAMGLLWIRRRSDLAREYSTPGYPALPLVFAFASFGIVLNQVMTNTRDSVIGLSLVLAGLPIYHIWARRGYVQRRAK
jgi:APA family basic amino acid/polyamine antiporter